MPFNSLVVLIGITVIVVSGVAVLVMCGIGFFYPDVVHSVFFEVAVAGLLVPILPVVYATIN